MCATVSDPDNYVPSQRVLNEDVPDLFAVRIAADEAGPRIDYREAGSGSTVVLLHGIASGADSWRPLAQRLAQQGWRVLAWNAPGYGASRALTKPEPLASDYARALHGLVEHCQLPRFTLVGHSLGALIAAAYGSLFAQRLHGLLLADPAQGYANADAEARARVCDERPNLLRQLGAEAYAQARAPQLLSADAKPAQLELVRASMRRLRTDGFAQANAMLANDDIWRYLPAWRGPLRVLCGDQDHITPLVDAKALATRMGAPCQALAGAGHASYIDRSDAFADALTAFAQTIQLPAPVRAVP